MHSTRCQLAEFVSVHFSLTNEDYNITGRKGKSPESCLHQNLKEEWQGLESSQEHVIKESIACRSEPADSNAALESTFFRLRQRITTKATIGAGTRHDGLYKKGKIRVQVILN